MYLRNTVALMQYQQEALIITMLQFVFSEQPSVMLQKEAKYINAALLMLPIIL